MSARYTSELANDFGNLASRVIAMIEKYCESIIPEVAVDEALASSLQEAVSTADSAITALDFQGGINAIMDFCKRVNGYVTEEAPWVLAKDPSKKEELDKVLYNTIEAVRALAVLLHPVMPATTTLLWESIGAQETMGAIGNQRIDDVATWGQLPPGSRITKGAVLFPRLEEKA
jgi:methionyl-tRNA synthetase